MPSLNIRIHSESEAIRVVRTFILNPKRWIWDPSYKYLTYFYDCDTELFSFRKTIPQNERACNINEVLIQVQAIIHPEGRV